MRTRLKSLPNLLLAFVAVTLMGANWAIRQPKAPPSVPAADEAAPSHGSTPAVADSAEAETATSLPDVNNHRPGPAAAKSIHAARSQPGQPAFDWAAIETTDYKEYAKRLKAVGFPEELVRDIIIADVNKIYEAREQALKPKPVPYDAPLSQRQTHDISAEDWQRITALRDLRMEKQSVLEAILGEYVPREILRTPISRNYEAYEYAISQLAPEKRDAVQSAQETEIYVEGYNKTTIKDRAAELESFKQTLEQRNDALRGVLTPEEFDRYQMITTPAGTELARRVIGMQPTDEEFQAMFRIAYKNWLDTGGVYGRWRAVPVPPQQIAAADREMTDNMRNALGPERFLELRRPV